MLWRVAQVFEDRSWRTGRLILPKTSWSPCRPGGSVLCATAALWRRQKPTRCCRSFPWEATIRQHVTMAQSRRSVWVVGARPLKG